MSSEFRIDGEALVRDVVPRRGAPYSHVCQKDVFDEVTSTIWWIEHECGSEVFTGDDIVKATGQPSTQVYTALAFLKERGCVVASRCRRSKAATDDVYLDGNIEWHALKEAS